MSPATASRYSISSSLFLTHSSIPTTALPQTSYALIIELKILLRKELGPPLETDEHECPAFPRNYKQVLQTPMGPRGACVHFGLHLGTRSLKRSDMTARHRFTQLCLQDPFSRRQVRPFQFGHQCLDGGDGNQIERDELCLLPLAPQL